MQVLANMAYVLLFASWKSIQHLIFGELREFERKVRSCTASYVPDVPSTVGHIHFGLRGFLRGVSECRD